MKTSPPPGSRRTLDRATLIGLVVSLGSISAGMVVEGGRVRDLLQLTAALIVIGGTAGAVLVNTSSAVFWRAIRRVLHVFLEHPLPAEALVHQLIGYASDARKNGIIALEAQAEACSDPFLRKALLLAVDSSDVEMIRDNMNLEIALEEQRLEEEAGVFESAGGYAPTVGIIGAVLGLIQVMKHLDNIQQVGHGIAVAFVATVYGVGLANLILLPAAGKLRARAALQIQMRELVLEGVVGIAQGKHPKLIRNKIEAYVDDPLSAAEPLSVPPVAGPQPNPAKLPYVANVGSR